MAGVIPACLVSWVNYWQAWVYWFVFLVSALVITVYFLKRGPKLVESRLKAGPIAEKEKSQKSIQALASIFFVLLLIVPAT